MSRPATRWRIDAALREGGAARIDLDAPVRFPCIEILSFAGCPNREAARQLVERVARELGLAPELRLVEVEDADAAVALRFLGSPTVRVDGVDVEPGAGEREDFALACRVYRTQHGFAGLPDERWIRDALAAASA